MSTAVEKNRVDQPVFIPQVDAWETDASIRLVADMPGVDEKSLEVSLDNGVLTLEGQMQEQAPEGGTLIGREYRTGRFRRAFEVTTDIDVAGIKARVKNGVVCIDLPKRETVRTRKIEINAG